MSDKIRAGLPAIALLLGGLAAGSVSGATLPPPAATPSPAQVPSGAIAAAVVPSGEIEAGAPAAGRHGDVVAPPGSHPFGRSYGRWAAAWWRWAVETAAPDHPLLDPHSANCDAGDQPGHVRFLGGNFTGGAGDPPVRRICKVRAGTALFFPLANSVWVSTPASPACGIAADPWYGATPRDPRFQQFRHDIVDPVGQVPANRRGDLTLQVDGKAVRGLLRHYVRSPVFFRTVLPDDNILDALNGRDCFPSIRVQPNVGWGYYVFLRPLPPGRHTIRWTANARLPLFPPDPEHQDVTYDLIVVPRG